MYFSLDELVKEVAWLKLQIEERGGHLMCHSDVTNTADAVRLSVMLLEESVILSPIGKVQLRLAHNHQEHIEEQSSLAHVMSMSLSHTHWDMITTVSHTHLLLSQYRNQLLHVFSAEGIIALVLNKRKSIDYSKSALSWCSIYLRFFRIVFYGLFCPLLITEQGPTVTTTTGVRAFSIATLEHEG